MSVLPQRAPPQECFFQVTLIYKELHIYLWFCKHKFNVIVRELCTNITHDGWNIPNFSISNMQQFFWLNWFLLLICMWNVTSSRLHWAETPFLLSFPALKRRASHLGAVFPWSGLRVCTMGLASNSSVAWVGYRLAVTDIEPTSVCSTHIDWSSSVSEQAGLIGDGVSCRGTFTTLTSSERINQSLAGFAFTFLKKGFHMAVLSFILWWQSLCSFVT